MEKCQGTAKRVTVTIGETSIFSTEPWSYGRKRDVDERDPIWVFPKMVVPPKHPKMIIFSRKTHGCWVPPFWETAILGVGWIREKNCSNVPVNGRAGRVAFNTTLGFKISVKWTHFQPTGCFFLMNYHFRWWLKETIGVSQDFWTNGIVVSANHIPWRWICVSAKNSPPSCSFKRRKRLRSNKGRLSASRFCKIWGENFGDPRISREKWHAWTFQFGWANGQMVPFLMCQFSIQLRVEELNWHPERKVLEWISLNTM